MTTTIRKDHRRGTERLVFRERMTDKMRVLIVARYDLEVMTVAP